MHSECAFVHSREASNAPPRALWSVPLVPAETIARLLDYPSLVAALRAAFLDPPVAPERLTVPIAREGSAAAGSLLVMPAVRAGGLITCKLVTLHPELGARFEGALRSTVVVLDAATGELRCLLDGHSLTNRRTAATSVLAAQTLARRDARRVTVLGAGGVAFSLAEAYATTFPLEQVAVWARRPLAAEALAAQLRAVGAPAVAMVDLEQAVRSADIVSTATLSEAPLLFDEWIRPGTHVDLVGGFRPHMREAEDALLARAFVVADGPTALEEAGDLVGPLASGALARSQVYLLEDILRDGAPTRSPGGVTVFKSVGLSVGGSRRGRAAGPSA